MNAFEQMIHAWARWGVDRFVASRSVAPALGLVGVLTALWLVLAAVLLGVVPLLGGAAPGPIPVPATRGHSDQVVAWASELEAVRPSASDISNLANADAAGLAWLKSVMCDAPMRTQESRAARAWRVKANSELCPAPQRLVILAPLSIRFGAFGGGLLTLALVGGLGFAALRLVRIVVGARRFYRRLYVSDYKLERDDLTRRRDLDDEETTG